MIAAIPRDATERASSYVEGRPVFSRYDIDELADAKIGIIWFSGLVHSVGELMIYFSDRLIEDQKRFGVRHDVIQAVLPREFLIVDLDGVFTTLPPRTRGPGVSRFRLRNWRTSDDPVQILARVHALQSFVGTEDGANLLAAYKRAANILKKEDWHGIEGEIARTGEEDPLAGVDDPDLAPVIAAKMAERHEKELSYTPEPAERALIEALDAAEPKAAAAVEAEDFEAAMAALASLRAPIDKFFDEVTVNDDDPSRRSSRLDLLARFRAAVHAVADFSRIEG